MFVNDISNDSYLVMITNTLHYCHKLYNNTINSHSYVHY